jgi:tetratricopeptide (TPR) repeat protein
MPYDYDPQKQLINLEKNKTDLTTKLLYAKPNKTTDSPVYQLVDGIKFQNSVAHEKTDIFRDKVKYNKDLKERLAQARELKGSKTEKLQAVNAIANKLVLENEETGVLIDVMLSYRALGDYDQMINFIHIMPAHVKQTVMVQEQLGFALNRVGKRDEAIRVLEKVIDENGPSSETYGILGRVYKDMFEEALKEKNELLAESMLERALETYMKGFEADWRDAYPGVNAVTLLALKGEEEKIKKVAPVVEYAVLRKMATKQPDYWDYATLLELAVIENDEAKAKAQLKKALACPIEKSWMLDTTIKNLRLINTYQNTRNESSSVSQKLIDLLQTQKEINKDE